MHQIILCLVALRFWSVRGCGLSCAAQNSGGGLFGGFGGGSQQPPFQLQPPGLQPHDQQRQTALSSWDGSTSGMYDSTSNIPAQQLSTTTAAAAAAGNISLGLGHAAAAKLPRVQGPDAPVVGSMWLTLQPPLASQGLGAQQPTSTTTNSKDPAEIALAATRDVCEHGMQTQLHRCEECEKAARTSGALHGSAWMN